MYDDSGRPPIGSSKLLIIFIIAIVVVMAGTIILNGGFSSPAPEVVENTTEAEPEAPTTHYQMVGNNSYGTVTKISGFGNPSSDIKIAFIVGVDPLQKASNAIVPTLQNEDMLNYCYDVYIVNTTSLSNKGNDENNDNNLTENEKSESLASEFAVPDIIKNNYNYTVDIHSTNDSNSYLFVPSENTYTSKMVLDNIVNTTGIGEYTPDTHTYTEAVSDKILNSDIPSIVYVTKEYYNTNGSTEISSVILAIDDFDFLSLISSDDSSATAAVSDNNVTNDTEEYENTITVSNSSGNQEVN